MRGMLGNVVKLCVLLLILFGIYRLWRAVPALTAAVPDDDDIKVQPRVTVHVGTVTRETLHAYRELDAIVEPQPARGLETAASAMISSQTPGVAAAVFCREGQHVQIGQPLLALDDRASQVMISHARAVLAATTADQAATTAAVKAGNVPPRDALRADLARTTAEADLSAALAGEDLLTVTSPIAGTVVKLNVAAGQAVGPGGVSVAVVDLDRLAAAAMMPGWVLRTLATGQRVEVSTDALNASTAVGDATDVVPRTTFLAASRREFLNFRNPLVAAGESQRVFNQSRRLSPAASKDVSRIYTLGEGPWFDPRAKGPSLWDAVKRGNREVLGVLMMTSADEASSTTEPATSQPTMVSATVTAIDPSVDPATGLGQVDVNLPAGFHFVPGQAVRLRVTIAEHSDVLTVPSESVAVDSTGRPSISGVERDFRWGIRHPVVVGLRDGARVEISGPGIHEGLDVVTTGAQALPDESLIEVVR